MSNNQVKEKIRSFLEEIIPEEYEEAKGSIIEYFFILFNEINPNADIKNHLETSLTEFLGDHTSIIVSALIKFSIENNIDLSTLSFSEKNNCNGSPKDFQKRFATTPPFSTISINKDTTANLNSTKIQTTETFSTNLNSKTKSRPTESASEQNNIPHQYPQRSNFPTPTLCLSGVPIFLLKRQKLFDVLSTFGRIVDLDLQVRKSSCIVQYKTTDEATKAKDALFDSFPIYKASGVSIYYAAKRLLRETHDEESEIAVKKQKVPLYRKMENEQKQKELKLREHGLLVKLKGLYGKIDTYKVIMKKSEQLKDKEREKISISLMENVKRLREAIGKTKEELEKVYGEKKKLEGTHSN